MDHEAQVSGLTGADNDADLDSYNIVPIIVSELAQLRKAYQLSGEQANSIIGSDAHVRSGNSGAVLLLRCSDEAFDMVIRSLDGQDLRLALLLLQRQVDIEEQTQSSLSHLAKLYRQTNVEKFLATAQQLMASQQRLASARSRILRCVSKQITNASDGQIDASVQPLIDRVLRYPELSSGYISPDIDQSTSNGTSNVHNDQEETKQVKVNGDNERELPLVDKKTEAECDEDMFESFAGPSVTLSPLVGMLMQRMAEERSPLIDTEERSPLIDTNAKERVRRVHSEERPERPKTPSPPGDDDDGPLSPFVGSLLGKSFLPVMEEEDEKTEENEVVEETVECQVDGVVMSADSSLTIPASNEMVVVPRVKKDVAVDEGATLEPPEPPRRSSSYEIIRRLPTSAGERGVSSSSPEEDKPNDSTPAENDEHRTAPLSPTTMASEQCSTFPLALSLQSEPSNEAELASPTASFSDTLDRKKHFTGNVTNLLKISFADDDEVDGNGEAETVPKATKAKTPPGSRETLLATASAGVRKERTTLPDMFDADLTALLKLTEQS